MSKLKAPFLSLGARGSVGGVVTVQERHRTTFVRTKPIPTYRHTLPQAYQRWLYEDYAYLWRKQSVATRQEYASAGVRHHLTGFQYWMKYHLTNLPDIVAWYKLDEKTGAVAYDAGRNGYNGVIIGASPADGVIDGARSFDGLNDSINVAGIPPPGFTEFTVLDFVSIPAFTGTNRSMIEWGQYSPSFGFYHWAHSVTNRHFFYAKNIAGVGVGRFTFFTPNAFFLGGGVWDGTTLFLIHNEIITPGIAFAGIVSPDATLYLGRQITAVTPEWYDGLIDNVIIFNRALDATEVKRWAERRYPLQ